MRPKISQRDDGFFIILDQRETPFWYALFISEEHALKAWEWYQDSLINASIHHEQHPDNY